MTNIKQDNFIKDYMDKNSNVRVMESRGNSFYKVKLDNDKTIIINSKGEEQLTLSQISEDIKTKLESDKQQNKQSNIESKSSTKPWKNHTINQSVDDDSNKNKLTEFHSQEEDDILKRLIPTKNFRCPGCLKRLQHKDIQQHADDNNHAGNFTIFKDPVTGKLFLIVGNGDELLDLSDTTKKETNKVNRLKKIKKVEEKIDNLIATDNYNNKINKLKDNINKLNNNSTIETSVINDKIKHTNNKIKYQEHREDTIIELKENDIKLAKINLKLNNAKTKLFNTILANESLSYDNKTIKLKKGDIKQ